MTADRALFDPKADSPATDEYLHALKERYQALDIQALAQHTLEETLGITPIAVQSLGGGENAMDHVLLSVEALYQGEHKEFVVRVNTSSVPEPRLVLETKLYALWQSKGVPAPRVYGVRLRTQAYPYDFMVMDKVGDLNLETYRRGRYGSVTTARSAGAFLANLHVVALRGFGPFASGYTDGHLVGACDSWEEAIREDVEGTLDYLERTEIMSVEATGRTKRIFEQHKSLLTLPEGVLLHGDFHPANILVYMDTGLVAGAVDLSQAKVGDPLFDIAFYGTYDTETFSEFMTGYAEVRPLPEDSKERLALYSLRILMSKAKLRKRFGYEDRIAAAIIGMEDALRVLG